MFNLFSKNNKQQLFTYGPSGPSYPDVVGEVELPSNPSYMPFHVKGWRIGDHKKQRHAKTYIGASNLVHLVNRVSPQDPKKWASVKSLSIIPEAGYGVNAFYNRSSISFCLQEVNGNQLSVADSGEAVTHETGHAILDAIRPDLWNIASSEIWAFHESFADICAISASIDYPWAINAALSETDGDLSKSNIISKIGEHIANSFNLDSIRDATIKFNYVEPEKLPKFGPREKLTSDPHSLGRVFLSAWYECLITEANRYDDYATGLIASRDLFLKCLIKAAQKAPRVNRFISAIGKEFSSEVRKEDESIGVRVEAVMIRQNIIKPLVKLLSVGYKHIDDFNLDGYEVVEEDNKVTLFKKNNSSINVDKLIKPNTLQALSLNIPKGTEIYVPDDESLEFVNGILVNQESSNKKDTNADAINCIRILKLNDDINDNGTWNVENKKLIRKKIS